MNRLIGNPREVTRIPQVKIMLGGIEWRRPSRFAKGGVCLEKRMKPLAGVVFRRENDWGKVASCPPKTR